MRADKIIFSIIVPVYNVEKYLRQCLDSIKMQTYKEIEVVLINDGSTDESRTICDEYVKYDSRFRVVHTINQGVSVARNLGIKESSGDYILFVDSDDYLEMNAVYKINKILENKSYDLMIYGIVKEVEDKKIIINSSEFLNEEYKSNEEIKGILPYLIKTEMINSPIKVYKSDLLKKEKIYFDNNINIGEDYLFNMKCFLHANNLYIIKEPLYHYMIRNIKSLSNKFIDDKYSQLVYVNDNIKKLIDNNINNIELNEAILYIRLKNIYSCFMDMHKKSCNYSYSKKIETISEILDRERCVNFGLIKWGNFKILAYILKLNSNILLYIVSGILFKLKK